MNINKEMWLDFKQKAIQEINRDPIHALPFQTRNEVFNRLESIQQKAYVILHTLKNLDVIWSKAWPHDNTFQLLLSSTINYVNGKMPKDDFLRLITSKHAYMENRIGEGKFDAGMAGLSLVYAGYEIIHDDFISKNEGLSSDPESWHSLFLASLAYNGGAEDLRKINAIKNKEFWYKFLDNIEESRQLAPIHLNIKELTATDKEKERKQVLLLTRFKKLNLQGERTDFDHILANIEKLNTDYNNLCQQKSWKEIIIRCYLVNNKASITGSYKESNKDSLQAFDNTELYLFNKYHNAVQIFKQIREEMYKKLPDEGAWYSLYLTIAGNQSYSIEFVYDTKVDFFDKFSDQTDFVTDFQKFPRSKEFTPKWLNDILLYNKAFN